MISNLIILLSSNGVEASMKERKMKIKRFTILLKMRPKFIS
jgi:hypothetical protein